MMEFTVATILYVALALIVIWKILIRVYDSRRYNYPPGPKGWPIVANTFSISMRRIHFSVWDHKDKYGDVSHFHFGGTRFVVLNTYDAIREAFKESKFATIFAGRPRTFFTMHYLPNDMGHNTYSEKWTKLRHLMQTAIKPYGNELTELETAIFSELSHMKTDLATMEGTNFDIYANLTRSIGNIMYILLIGQRFDYDHKIHDLQRTFDLATITLFNPFVNRTLTLFPFLSYFNFGLGKAYHTSKNLLEEIYKYIYYDIKEENAFENKKGILYDLLRKQRDSDWLTDDNVHDLIANIIMPGIITTSSSLYAMFLILLYRPDVQERIQEEIDNVIGRTQEPRLVDQEKMPYVRAVILELLRYSTIAPYFLPHATMEDVTFRGYRLKKGTVILANNWRVHHDDQLWDDPWSFTPERFLDDQGQLVSPEDEKRRNHMVFGLGKRRCIGEVFARTRLFLFVTHLCQRFTVYSDDMTHVPDMDPHDYRPYFILTPKPYLMKLKVRR